jgi:hypothetical protein
MNIEDDMNIEHRVGRYPLRIHYAEENWRIVESISDMYENWYDIDHECTQGKLGSEGGTAILDTAVGKEYCNSCERAVPQNLIAIYRALVL